MWGIGRNAIPRGAKSQRVDVYQRTRTSSGRRFLHAEELVESGARAMITARESIPGASLFGPGTGQEQSVSVVMDSTPVVLAGYVLQVTGTQIRYTVKAATPVPAHGRRRIQVLDCVLDPTLEPA